MIRGRADIRCPLCLTCTDIWNSTSGPTSQPTNQPQIAIQKASRKFILRISGTKWHKFFFLDKRNRLVLHFVKSKSTWNFETRVNQDHLHSVIQFALERTEPGKTFACITRKEKKVREKLKTTSDLWGRQGCRGQVGAPVDFPLLWIRPTHAQQNIHTQTIFDQLIFLKSDFPQILHLRQGIILKDDIHKRFLWQWKPRVLGTVCVFLETGRNRLLPRVSGGRGGEMSFDQIWQLGLQWSASHNGGIKEGWNMKRSRNVNSDLPGDLEKEFLWSDLLVGARLGTVEEGNEKGREWSTENEDQCDRETSESSSKDTRY